MCDEIDSVPADAAKNDVADGPGSWSRRKVLQSGMAISALAVAPPLSLVPSVPEAGRETPGPEPASKASRFAFAAANWPVPPIVTRAEWGADESRRAPNSAYDFDTVVTKLVVHHTVTPNNAANDADVVRGIYNYHTSVGYNDIAYSFLIGRNGRLYEGRWARDYPAGVPHIGENAQGRNVRAAHSTATNTQTIGVALLGDYRSTGPTDLQLETLATFLAWKTVRWGLEVFGAVPYLDGRVFPTISGHRDVTSTSCPGDGVYGILDYIRALTALKSRPGTTGYWIGAASGSVDPFGDLPDFGDPRRIGAATAPIVGIANYPAQPGYWCVSSDGGVFTFGYAPFFGSAGNLRLNRPVVGMAVTPSGGGYWLVASDGGIFTYGDAQFYGSTGNIRLNQPIVGMAATPTGRGYWMVASDGGVFSFGDAQFYGSTGNIRLNQPIVGMAATPSGGGYWLVASDGGIFTFGNAPFRGSLGALRLNEPIVGMAATASGSGYILVAADGGIFTFGDARFGGAIGRRGHGAIGVALRA